MKLTLHTMHVIASPILVNARPTTGTRFGVHEHPPGRFRFVGALVVPLLHLLTRDNGRMGVYPTTTETKGRATLGTSGGGARVLFGGDNDGHLVTGGSGTPTHPVVRVNVGPRPKVHKLRAKRLHCHGSSCVVVGWFQHVLYGPGSQDEWTLGVRTRQGGYLVTILTHGDGQVAFPTVRAKQVSTRQTPHGIGSKVVVVETNGTTTWVMMVVGDAMSRLLGRSVHRPRNPTRPPPVFVNQGRFEQHGHVPPKLAQGHGGRLGRQTQGFRDIGGGGVQRGLCGLRCGKVVVVWTWKEQFFMMTIIVIIRLRIIILRHATTL